MTLSRKLQLVGLAVVVVAGSAVAEYYGDFSGQRRTGGLSVVVLVTSVPFVAWAGYWGWSRDPAAALGTNEAEQLAIYRRVLAAPRVGSDLAAPAAVPIAVAVLIGLIAAFCELFDLVSGGTLILVTAICSVALLTLAIPLALWHRPRVLLPALYRAAYRAQVAEKAVGASR